MLVNQAWRTVTCEMSVEKLCDVFMAGEIGRSLEKKPTHTPIRPPRNLQYMEWQWRELGIPARLCHGDALDWLFIYLIICLNHPVDWKVCPSLIPITQFGPGWTIGSLCCWFMLTSWRSKWTCKALCARKLGEKFLVAYGFSQTLSLPLTLTMRRSGY